MCDPVWDLLAEKGLPEDISRTELAEVRDAMLGRSSPTSTSPQVSLRFHDDEVNVAAVRNLIPAMTAAADVDGYRYATWTDVDTGTVEPFVIALSQRGIGVHAVVATMFVGATFLRYEQEFGAVSRPQLDRFARAVAADLRLIGSTHGALLDA